MEETGGDADPVCTVNTKKNREQLDNYAYDLDSPPIAIANWYPLKRCPFSLKVSDNLLDSSPVTDPEFTEFIIQQLEIKPGNNSW